MKLIVDLEKKSLKMLENERSIFRGEYGADKLILLINKQLVNEYPTITALLSNGRKIGAYSTDEAYGTEIIDGVTYTTASFTLSKQNGFTLSEGQMQITIWMNSNSKKEAIGNVTLNVINTTAFDDGDIIISGDVEGTLVNYRVELENLQGQVNTFNGRLTNVETNKVDKTYLENEYIAELDERYINATGDTFTGTMYMDVSKSETPHLIGKHSKIGIRAIDESGTMVGQFAISDSNKDTYDGHYASIQALGNDNNLYSLRVSKKGAQFKNGATGITHQLATEDFVGSQITTNINKTESKIALSYNAIFNTNRNHIELEDEIEPNGLGVSLEISLINKYPSKGEKLQGFIKTSDNYIYYFIAEFLGKEIYSNGKTYGLFEITFIEKMYGNIDKEYVDNKINELFGEGNVDKTLDTIAEISNALKNNLDVVEAINNSITYKAEKSEVEAIKNRVNQVETNKTDKTQTNIIANRVTKLEEKIIGASGTKGIVEDNTLYLYNARVENDTLYIKGLSVEQNTLLFDDVTFINGTLVVNNPLVLNSAVYKDGTLIIGG